MSEWRIYVRLSVLPVTLLWFPHIYWQTAHGIHLKLGGYIHYGTPQMWLNLLMLRWILAISWPLIDRAVSAHFRTNHSRDRSQAWWTHSLWYSPDRINFGHALLNSRCLLASNWSISFRAFAANSWSDRPQIWWANSQRGLSWPDQHMGFCCRE